jgi:hypothetical protein
MGSSEMSKRTHWTLRLVALAILAAATWLPRTSPSASGASSASGRTTAAASEAQAIHASVASR